MKRVICAIILTIFFISHNVLANEAQSFVKNLEIMQGDEAGNFNGDGLLTREQLAKITVKLIEPEFIPSNSVSPFFDVPYQSWAAGYIKRSNELGHFTGYPDGSFLPREFVTPEQMSKIMMSLLGYQNEGAASDWAAAQINAAHSLGLLEGVHYEIGAPITRMNAAIMIKNTLLSQKKDSNTRLVSEIGYSYFENAIIITDKNISDEYVLTTVGSFKKGNLLQSDIFKKGSLIIDKDNRVAAFIPLQRRYDSYIVKTIISDTIIVFGKEGDISIKCDNDIVFYDGTAALDFKSISATLEMGDKITVCRNNSDKIEYITVARDEMEGPFTNAGKSFINAFGITDQTIIYRDGKVAQMSEIIDHDICYYIRQTDTALIYSVKITGVYQEALPGKDNLQAVIISGKQYEVGSVGAFDKLSSGGIEYGTPVKALFGKDGKIADILTFSQNDGETGYLIDTSFKTWIDGSKDTFTEYCSTILLTDGTINEYYTDKDYEYYKGKTVSIKFEDNKAVISPQAAKVNIEGTFNWDKKSFGSYTLSDDINIIDVAFNDEYTKAKGAKVFPKRLNGAVIKSNDILYVRQKDNLITDIILKDFTNDLYSYGMVLKAENKSGFFAVQGVYDLNVSGVYTNFATVNKRFPVYTGQPVKIDFDNGAPFSLSKLFSINEKITKIDDLYVHTENAKYALSDDFLIYKSVYNSLGDGESFEIIPKNKVDYAKSIAAYYDKPQEEGGRVRIIVVAG
ncbi:MAG: S-layer homology domain-containing protein [Firmicutes bacterium]|nr:S-layer homology domain-containing protein [Bacillota bacterium]